ncbi:MAG: hypothetical protein JWM04_1394, partial [Verrucomicrobiales bacterium]|nr:hypothetical protein [Verrucomicrobiales bacterium]
MRRTFFLCCMLSSTEELRADGISLSGIVEGSVVTLSNGSAITNLALKATPTVGGGGNNMVFILERQGIVNRQFTSPPPYSVTLTNLPAGKYLAKAALLSSGVAPSGDLSFDVVAASLQPYNDNRVSAGVISALDTLATSFNTYATSETEEPIHAGVGAGKSVWWTWTPRSSGVTTATTAGSAFDTVLGVYMESNKGDLVEVGSNDDAGLNSFSQ